jgi:hypothetical protein
MPYFLFSLTKSLGTDFIVEAASEEEAKQIAAAKDDDEFYWYVEESTELEIGQISDNVGAAMINKTGGRGDLLPHGILKMRRDLIFHVVHDIDETPL